MSAERNWTIRIRHILEAIQRIQQNLTPLIAPLERILRENT